jgi:hypothetical protein
VQELLEALGGDELREDAQALLRRQRRVILAWLHALDQPVAAQLVADLHELRAERARVRPPETPDQLRQGALGARQIVAEAQAPGRIPVTEAEVRGVEQRVRVEILAQRVELRDQVTVAAEGVDEPHDADDGDGVRAVRHWRRASVRARRDGSLRGRHTTVQAVEQVAPALRNAVAPQHVVVVQRLDPSAVLAREEPGQLLVHSNASVDGNRLAGGAD